MNVYVDNDIIHKLSAFGLVDAVLAALGASRADAVILGTARFKFLVDKPEKGTRRYGKETHERISAVIKDVRALEQAPAVAGMDVLSGVVGIDPGEAILFATAASDADALLLTGDKNALRALAALPANDVTSRLQGRVLCLEQLLELLIKRSSFEAVRDAVAAERGVDGAMKIIFSNGTMTEEAHAKEGFASHLRSLRSETGDLLQPDR